MQLVKANVKEHILWVYAEACSVRLHEFSRDIFRSLVNIGAAGIFGEIPLERDIGQFVLEYVDLTEEENYWCP